MAAGEDWTEGEVKVLVLDYLEMLRAELGGLPYVKAHHNREMQAALPGRSRGSIEFKYANVSAALQELGYTYVLGYQPRSNYQSLLDEVVAEQVAVDSELAGLMAVRVAQALLDEPAVTQDLVQSAPPVLEQMNRKVRERKPRTTRVVNWLEVEARNQALGRAGELAVVHYEMERLRTAGQRGLADRVEHVAAARGDGAGYDVRSFERDGRDRLIEVKTTQFGEYTPFFASRNEVDFSEDHHDHYHVYRLHSFRRSPTFFVLSGALRETCMLSPVSYEARPGAVTNSWAQ